jgi:T4 RnlA family RNA ligase
MELQLQKYLRTPGKSLETLKAELGIEYSLYDYLVVLNYSQIDSPKSHPIVMECRGIILERNSWNIVSYPFRRFFNDSEVQEITETFDFSKATALEKLDGSLISVFRYKDKWLMSTRGVIENSGPVGFFAISFRDLFYEVTKKYPNFWSNLSPDFTYCFELTAPENRVVTVYPERDIHLLTMRRVETWQELFYEDLSAQAVKLGVSLPLRTVFNGKEGLLELARKLATLQEGYVAVDYTDYDVDGISFKRVKVKNPSYVAIHHLKDRAGRSLRSLVSLVYSNEQDEFLNYFKEFKPYIDIVQEAYTKYIKEVETEVVSLQKLFGKERTKENRKEFALSIAKSRNSSYLFMLYEGRVKSLSEFLQNMEKLKTRKCLERYLVEQLKLKDLKIYAEE